MKRNYFPLITVFILLCCITVGAQSAQKNFINYQGVARDADNTLMEQENLEIGINLKFGSASSPSVYAENHSVVTDANGVFSLKIGNGNSTIGKFEDLPWGEAAFMAVSLNDIEIGTSELMAVPYAITSGDKQWTVIGSDIENKNEGEVNIKNNFRVKGGFNLSKGNQVNEISDNGSLSENSNGILPTQRAVKTYVDNHFSQGGGVEQNAAEVPYDNAGSGLVATDAQAAIDELVAVGGGEDADTNPTNEFQNLSLSGTSLQISDGTGVDLSPIIPPGGTDDQNATEVPFDNIASGLVATDVQTAIDELATSGLVDTDDQSLSLSGTTLQITDGTGVDLSPIIPPGGTDDQNATEVPFDNTASGLRATDTQAAIDELASGGVLDTDDQGLVLTGDILTIEDGTGSIDLSVYGDDGDADPNNEVDVTAQTGILLGDGATVSGLIGTADGDVAKWDAVASTWVAAADEIGGGGLGTPTGLEALDEGSGIGWRLIGKDPTRYGPIGEDATDLSSGDPGSSTTGATGEVSTAMGEGTTASGQYSTATGYYTIADGQGSIAMGTETTATGYSSTVSGDGASASGSVATALGGSTSATGEYATAMGQGTNANAYISTAIGSFNIGGGNETTWNPTDPLFEIGNGTLSTRSNALTVLKNGNTGIGTNAPAAQFEINSSQERPFILRSTKPNNYMQYVTPAGVIGYSGVWSGDNDVDFGTVEFNAFGKVHLTTKATPRLTVTANGNVGIGTTDPTTKLHIKSNSTVGNPQITIEEDDNDYARIELTNSTVRFWHLAGYVGATKTDDRFNIFNSEEGNILSVHGNGNVVVNGVVAHSSDRRLKKDIITLPYGLETVMQLAPKAYYWKKDNVNDRRALGLIAQEVQPIIKEVVHGGDDEEDMLSISYTELVPVLIKAIQEQQSIIEDRSTKISDLETRLAKLEAKL